MQRIINRVGASSACGLSQFTCRSSAREIKFRDVDTARVCVLLLIGRQIPLHAVENESANDSIQRRTDTLTEVCIAVRAGCETLLTDEVDQVSHATGIETEMHSSRCNGVGLVVEAALGPIHVAVQVPLVDVLHIEAPMLHVLVLVLLGAESAVINLLGLLAEGRHSAAHWIGVVGESLLAEG